MSILAGLLGAREDSGITKSEKHELYYGGANWGDVMGGTTLSGENVSPDTALNISAYFAAINIIAGAVGFLPTLVYRRTDKKNKEKATDYPSYDLLHTRAHPHMDAATFKETLQGHALSWGNGYAHILRTGGGVPYALRILQPYKTHPALTKSGALIYKTTEDDGTRDAFPFEDVLHIKGMGGDGYKGWSVARKARESLGLAKASEKMAASFYGNNATPGGYLSHPNKLSAEAADNLRRSWNDIHQGASNAGKVGVLEEGMEWKAAGMPLKDAQFLEGRKFQVTEIARWFQIPPHYLADLDRATFSNIEHQGLQFVMMTLMRHFVRWEMETSYKLIMPRDRKEYFVNFLPDALLRGDLKSRYDAYHLAIMDGHMNRNEVRALENRNWEEGLDEFLLPQNMIPADRLGAAQGGAAASLEHIRPCAVDVLGRWRTRQANAVKRAGEKYAAAGEGFARWADEWFGREHVSLEQMMAGVRQSIEAVLGRGLGAEMRAYCEEAARTAYLSLRSENSAMIDNWVAERNPTTEDTLNAEADCLFAAMQES